MQHNHHSSRLKDRYVWRILLIDDDEDDYVIVRQMLSDAREGKFTLEWAPSFEVGKQTLQTDRTFDAVLVDYDMGRHTGIEIIREAVFQEYPGPLLLHTGRGTYEIDVEAMEAGAADYLSKGGMNATFLERVIRYAIERKKNEIALRNSETQLRESKDRYQTLFNTMLNGFAVHEMVYNDSGKPVDYRFLEINLAFEQLTGLKGSEIIGKTVNEVMPGIDQVWIEMYGKVALTGEPVQFQDFASPLNRHYLVYAFSPRKNQFATIFSDVTDRVQTESALRESELRFRAIFENWHTVMLLIDPETAAIVDANGAACLYYGWSHDEMVRMNISQINTLSPDETRRKMGQAQSTSTSEIFNFQHRLANGSVRDVEVRSGPVNIGSKQLLFSIIHDITDHQRTQQALLEQEARLRDANDQLRIALQAANLGVWSLDLHGDDFEADEVARRMHGFGPEEDVSEWEVANRFMYPADLKNNEDEFRSAVEQSGVFAREYRVILPSGEVRWIYSFGGLDEDRKRVRGVVMDITERKKA